MMARRHPVSLLIVAAVLAIAVLTACAAPLTDDGSVAGAESEAFAEAVLTRAMTSEPASLDPEGPPSSGLSLVLPYLFDTLVTRDVDNTIVTLLAALDPLR